MFTLPSETKLYISADLAQNNIYCPFCLGCVTATAINLKVAYVNWIQDFDRCFAPIFLVEYLKNFAICSFADSLSYFPGIRGIGKAIK